MISCVFLEDDAIGHDNVDADEDDCDFNNDDDDDDDDDGDSISTRSVSILLQIFSKYFRRADNRRCSFRRFKILSLSTGDFEKRPPKFIGSSLLENSKFF